MNLLDLLDDEPAPPIMTAHLTPTCLGEPRLTAHQMRATITIWPGETCQRNTWTCDRCGEIRGRI